MEPTGFDWAMLWVSAVGSGGTIIALAVAVVLGLRESHAVRRENDRRDGERREAQLRRRRAQAECISAQLQVRKPAGAEYHAPDYFVGEPHHAWAEVSNASSLPVYDVVVTTYPRGSDKPARAGVKIIPGGQAAHVHTQPEYSTRADGDPVELHFRDAAGVKWHRLEDGELHSMIDHDVEVTET